MSTQQVPPDPELAAIEEALGALSPSRGRLDRDRLMFRAGQVSHRPTAPGRWGWPAVAGVLAVVALGQAVALRARPASRVVDRVVVVRVPALPSPDPAPVVILSQSPPAPPEAPTVLPWPLDYERLRRQIIRFGLDGLPEPPTFALRPGGRSDRERPEPSGALLRSEIARLLNPGEPL